MTQPTLEDIAAKLDDLSERIDKFENRLEKVDGRLWTLSLSLISTAWAAIFAAAGVVIFRTLSVA